MRFYSLLALLIAGVVSCGSAPRPNILLVVIDTLRSDRLGCYGNDRGLTPFLDSLAERGFVMHRAYAQSSWTSPSVASLFTSRFQTQHGVIRMGALPWQNEVTLAEVLRDNNYATGGFSANGVLRGRADRMDGTSRRPGSGFGQGFAYYEAKVPERIEGIRSPALWKTARADEINRDAMRWLEDLPDGGESPVFLYLHYMEPHIPYAPEEEYLGRAFAGRALPDMGQVNHSSYHGNNISVADSMLRDIQAVYDASVMSIDAGLRRLFSELTERGFLDDAIVVITADHGDEFRDHGLLGHGKTLYEEVIRVPLLILMPGQTERVDVEDVVSLVDVAPTLLEWLHIVPPDSFAGRSMQGDLLRQASWWRRRVAEVWGMAASEPRLAYSELIRDKNSKRLSPHERALVMDGDKLILDVGGEGEFYDTRNDPGEKNPDALTDRRRTTLRKSLTALLAHVSHRDGETKPLPLDPATKETLRALGYTED